MSPAKDKIDWENVKLKSSRENSIPLKDILKEELKDLEFQKAYEAESLKYEIAAKIRARRKAKKLSQQHLARLAHTTQKVVSRIECGEVSVGVDLLQRITSVLGLRLHIQG